LTSVITPAAVVARAAAWVVEPLLSKRGLERADAGLELLLMLSISGRPLFVSSSHRESAALALV